MEPRDDNRTYCNEAFVLEIEPRREVTLEVPWGGAQFLRTQLSNGCEPYDLVEIVEVARAIRRLDEAEHFALPHLIEASLYVNGGGLQAAAAYFSAENGRWKAYAGAAAVASEPISPLAIRVFAVLATLEQGHPSGIDVKCWRDQHYTFHRALAQHDDNEPDLE